MRKQLVGHVVTFIITLVIGLLLLVGAFGIPSEFLGSNLNKSIKVFEAEGTYPSYGLYPRKIVLDNFTESIMVNTAYSVNDNSLRSILSAERQILSTSELNQIKNLRAAVDGNANLRSSYERYWHGYLIFLRPLLSVMPYSVIRILLHAALYGLFGLLLIKIWKQQRKSRVAALVIGAIAVDFFWLGQSIQFSQVFIIGIIMALLLLKYPGKAGKIFFAGGALTSFFDLLTAPLVVLGFLLIADGEKKSFTNLVKQASLWSMGYLLFWTTKWLLTELFLGSGAISNALVHVVNRTVTSPDANFSHFRAIQLNLAQLVGYAKLSQIIVGLIGVGLFGLWLSFKKKKVDISKVGYWLMMGLIPYAWYLVTANHCYLHVWFTYRSQFMTIAGLFLAYVELVDWQKVNKVFKHKS